MKRLALADRLLPIGNTLTYVRYLEDFPAFPFNNFWDDTVTSGFGDPKVYAVQTNTKVVERCVLMTTDPGDLVLDPTCGSGTTAFVAEQWGRRWITIDTSRVAIALARTRLMAAKFPSYLLVDSPEGARKESELTGQAVVDVRNEGNVRKGFAYRRMRHVTLKSIATNPDIHPGMSREEIEATIGRHAETELLYDQPYEHPRRVRVSGRFTVESVAPHRVVDPDRERPIAEQVAETTPDTGSFEQTILDNLRKAGVQNTVRQERLNFSFLEPFAGEWIQAGGEYVDAAGETRRAAVSLGPQYGTVSPEQVKQAAMEAVKGVGFDILLVCGFAFDPYASETANEFGPRPNETSEFAVTQEERRLGRLPVQLVRINPDLAMGDTLLKKTGAGNLFTVFGEPDIEITAPDDGRLVVEIHGVDVFDPTTATIHPGSPDDIACWLIDTAYNGESFFVRHAYFTGSDDPYKRLRQALRAEIDPDTWASLYTTKSRPFQRPDTGKIAVKVINQWGDEVLKIYDV
jgi:adenine-specific DNA-methyltransferase